MTTCNRHGRGAADADRATCCAASAPTRPSSIWPSSRSRGGARSSPTSPPRPELSDAQRTRLTEVLTRIYGHPVAVQLHVDPELLGGLSITVGDEVIDGSIASRLAAAQTQLPD